jgi:hypothetical protein
VTSAEAVYEVAGEAMERARARLRERGRSPELEAPRLVRALGRGIVQVLAREAWGLDPAAQRAYVAEVARRLEAEPLVDRPPVGAWRRDLNPAGPRVAQAAEPR